MDFTHPQTASRSHSRTRKRSSTNLHHLSLAPLSSKFPIDDLETDDDPPDDPRSFAAHHRTSYLQGKSAPTTPSILRTSSSRTRLGLSTNHVNIIDNSTSRLGHDSTGENTPAGYVHEGVSTLYLPRANWENRLPVRAKSSTALLAQKPRQHGDHTRYEQARGRALGTKLRVRTPGTRQAEDGDEWLSRAGALIAGSARESKGQSWLARRESSTSLVSGAPDAEEEAGLHRAKSSLGLTGFADDEYSPVESRGGFSRFASRNQSRRASARNSRRGSRVSLMSPLVMGNAAGGQQGGGGGYFDGGVDAMGEEEEVEPDFVDEDARVAAVEGALEEQEVTRMSRERGFGLGGWVDSLVGWAIFGIDEGLEEEDKEEESMGQERREKSAADLVAEARKQDTEEEVKPESSEMQEQPPIDSRQEKPEDEGGWKDAAWLLSVASKVLLE